MSRLPTNSIQLETEINEKEYLNFYIEEQLLVDAKMIKKVTRTDIILSKVYLYVMSEWSNVVDNALKPYFIRKDEISAEIIFLGIQAGYHSRKM